MFFNVSLLVLLLETEKKLLFLLRLNYFVILIWTSLVLFIETKKWFFYLACLNLFELAQITHSTFSDTTFWTTEKSQNFALKSMYNFLQIFQELSRIAKATSSDLDFKS